ncbi:MAG: SDR family NAD(P)-dependent oxidoreductase [Lachnospiraceae bacterium]|nr:SDR family NAD(P)-dependent oxidoreductase [Lachnospiraceae bacterium]
MFRFDNRVAIVTGSGSKRGIGRATAMALSEQGASLVIADMSEEGVKETVKAIKEKGGKAVGVAVDVRNEESVANMVKTAIDTYGKIDILVNNAGISQKLSVADMQLSDMKRIFDVNIFGLFLCTKAVLPYLKANHYGRIVSLSSAAGKRGGGFLGGPHYSASKAAVLGFSKNLAREVAADGITVNCVAPGLIFTDMNSTALSDEEVKNIVATIPIGRRGRVEEVAAAITFLASEEASFITGEDIDINGGSHMD